MVFVSTARRLSRVSKSLLFLSSHRFLASHQCRYITTVSSHGLCNFNGREVSISPTPMCSMMSSASFSSKATIDEGSPSDGVPSVNPDNILEDRDPKFDAMLNQMVGRIQTKAGGKLQMGQASVGERYSRPMPKLRNTNTESSRYEERAVPAGTLNVAQLRHIILLHQGKADDHSGGPMDVQQIADKFRVDVVQVQKIVQFISLPPEDESKQKHNQ